MCKSTESKKTSFFSERYSSLDGVPKELISDRDSAFMYQERRKFCGHRNNEFRCSPSRLLTGICAVGREMQSLKSMIKAILVDNIDFTGSVIRAVRVMRLTINTGFKGTPFELHPGRKLQNF